MRRGTSLLTKSLPASLLRDVKTSFVEHIALKFDIFSFHKFADRQPVFQAAFLAGVE